VWEKPRAGNPAPPRSPEYDEGSRTASTRLTICCGICFPQNEDTVGTREGGFSVGACVDVEIPRRVRPQSPQATEPSSSEHQRDCRPRPPVPRVDRSWLRRLRRIRSWPVASPVRPKNHAPQGTGSLRRAKVEGAALSRMAGSMTGSRVSSRSSNAYLALITQGGPGPRRGRSLSARSI
jgi:hypothetical protein